MDLKKVLLSVLFSSWTATEDFFVSGGAFDGKLLRVAGEWAQHQEKLQNQAQTRLQSYFCMNIGEKMQ
jgi:hypothetical protein